MDCDPWACGVSRWRFKHRSAPQRLIPRPAGADLALTAIRRPIEAPRWSIGPSEESADCGSPGHRRANAEPNADMNPSDPTQYLRNAVLTASPEQLHMMLIDGAIRFSMQARDAVEAADYEESYQKLSRAQAIILEMQTGLRPEVQPELCDRMRGIYNFIYRSLVDASVQKNVERIDDALRVLRVHRRTWELLVDKVAAARAGEPDPPHTRIDSDKAETEDRAATIDSINVQG